MKKQTNKKTAEKVQLLHPEGKNAPAISKEIYTLFENAILETLKSNPGITYTDIAKGVHHYFSDSGINFKGSVEWYAVTVKMHLDATGIIESYLEKGKKLHRIKKQSFTN